MASTSQQGKVLTASGESTMRRSCARMPTNSARSGTAAFSFSVQFHSSARTVSGPVREKAAKFLQPVRRATASDLGSRKTSSLEATMEGAKS